MDTKTWDACTLEIAILALGDELEKDAGIRDSLGRIRDYIRGTPVKSGVFDPKTGKELVIPMRHAFQDLGESLEESGRLLQAKRTEDFVRGLPEEPGALKRTLGAGLEGLGTAYRSPLEVAYSPVGYPLGRFTRGALGRGSSELAEAGHPLAAKVVQHATTPVSVLTEAAAGAAPAMLVSPAAAALLFGKSSLVTSGQEAGRRYLAKRDAKKALEAAGGIVKKNSASVYGHWGIEKAAGMGAAQPMQQLQPQQKSHWGAAAGAGALGGGAIGAIRAHGMVSGLQKGVVHPALAAQGMTAQSARKAMSSFGPGRFKALATGTAGLGGALGGAALGLGAYGLYRGAKRLISGPQQ